MPETALPSGATIHYQDSLLSHPDHARRPSVLFIMGLGMQVTRHASRVSHDTSDCDICHMTHALSSLRGPTPLYNASSTAASASFAWTTAILA